MIAVSRSSAFLIGLTVAASGLAILLGLVWFAQSRRSKRLRKFVQDINIPATVSMLQSDPRHLELVSLVERAELAASTLAEASRPPTLWQVKWQSRLTQLPKDMEKASTIRGVLREELFRYETSGARLQLVPIEALTGKEEASLFAYLAEMKQIRRVEERLGQEIRRAQPLLSEIPKEPES